MPTEKILMTAPEIDQALRRMAQEILEGPVGPDRLALVGIRTRGVSIARRIAAILASQTGDSVPVGILDITLYRDDLTDIASQPIVRATEISFRVDRRRLVLVDDVLFTGRTVRAAIDQLIDFGRPERIELLVLVDRGWRELPFRADFVGIEIRTHRKQMVHVRLQEDDGREEVVLVDEDE